MRLARRASEASLRLTRPGISTPSPMRYASTGSPSDWVRADRGRGIIDGILDAIEDGADRVILAWSNRPGGGFAAAAVAMREARSSGRLAHAAIGLWPWRNGATWAARSVLVNPEDVLQAARRAIDEIQHGANWAKTTWAQESLCLLEMRLRDLLPPDGQVSDEIRSKVVVRNPTLLETTAVFPPVTTPRSPVYVRDASQVLRRVRDHTHMRDKDAGLETHVAAIGDPTRTPFGIFGLPNASKADALLNCLDFSRFKTDPLDAVVVDLTKNGRSELPDDWEPRLSLLMQSLAASTGRRPPVVVLTEDAFAWRRAVRTLRSAGASAKPARKAPLEIGAYLPEPGLFGSSIELATKLSPIRFDADIKDASLASLRNELVALGRTFRQGSQPIAADGVSKALAFLRRAASLPIGLSEARSVVDILYDGDDEVDAAARALFRPKMELDQLAAAATVTSADGEKVRRLVTAIQAKAAMWEDETPVSAKLIHVLGDPEWDSRRTLLAIPDRRTADVYLGSERALRQCCVVVDHRGLAERLLSTPPLRIIVVGPTPIAIRTLLTTTGSPERVLLLGDAAGSALLAAEIGPLSRISAFAPIAGRVQALAAALQRGGADEKLDLAEAEFRIAAALPEGDIDFTQAGEPYRGDIVHLTTSRNHRIAYRPASDVLEFSPGETRPFERKPARGVECGDRILVLKDSVREQLRRALAGSRESLKQLSTYHERIRALREATPGASDQDKARHILAKMRELDPALSPQELPNVVRWMTADKATAGSDGNRQPRAARDELRFRLFMQAAGIVSGAAELFWRGAIVPARSYRIQEGYNFNQRVVRFVLDPEGAVVGSAAWKSMLQLWQQVLDAVDEVSSVSIVPADGGSPHA